ncbi:PREDICTED: microtubule-associated protein futsch-like isoform X2 [Papilio polytes]|uniref:microtubule-associated protein futsch-like isoform X2 n=1 Tax=Papilio polytes TaxID=76194 RepID=UPI0006765C8E|nr:PREDICTED: microtubule-associated protein futsch-like isoform X2 [Papilio polytes]
MSGKAYTIKEMKSIVDYLTEHKAYNEIKGRKMWVDFERSKVLDRTWQSLKETFLKRILPDIHNPYYQLSVTQISSFRNGYDVEAKLNNKLEIRTVSEESNIDIEQAINTEHPSTSNANASGKKSGEDTISTKTITQHRSSAETVVIDTCYDTAEDIQKELEGINDEKNNSSQTTQKSLRDFITYSEPLIPAIQDVINDFATDEESDTVSKMEIVENINTESSKAINETTEAIVISDTEDVCDQNVSPDQSEKNVNDQDNEVTIENNEQLNKTGQVTQTATETSVQEITSTEDVVTVQSSSDLASEQVTFIDTDKNKEIVTSNNAEDIRNSIQNEPEKINNGEEIITQNTTGNTTDSIIPNNQEALNTQCEMVSQTKHNESKTTENSQENQSKSTENKDNQSKLTENYEENQFKSTENSKENQSKSTENNKDNQSKPTEKDKEAQFKINESNKRKRATSQGPAVPKGKRSLIKNSKPFSVSDTDVGIKENQKDNNIVTKTYSKPKPKKLKMANTEKKEESIPDRNTKELEKVTEINEDEIPATDVTKIQPTKNISPEIQNPCLKSVSLYEEEFTSTRYTESSDAGVPETRERPKERNTETKNSDNDILQLTSHSESHSESELKRKSPPVHRVPIKSEREKILANVFGFSSGATRHGRKRRISHRKSAPRQPRTRLLSSDSSEWTSESDTEYVSPPRGRKDRHPKKYLRQKPARIYSLEENGGLFVMHGKKIYPVVKDGKLVKGYVTYASERDSGDEDESYWKHKYIEEKKRAAQLTKLLRQSENNNQPQSDRCSEVDLTNPSPPKKQKISTPQMETKLETSAIPENIPNKTAPEVQKEPALPKEVVRNEPVKIKITKQNKEIELEGHWSQLHPIFDHVYEIFHKQVEPVTESKPSPPSKQSKTCLSGLSTPIIPHIDPVTHATVSKLETEIFAEINARDKIERSITPLSISSDSSKLSKRNEQTEISKKSIMSDPRTPEIEKNELNSSNEVEKERNMKKVQNVEKEQNVEKLASGDGENKTSPTTVPKRVTRRSMNTLRESTESKVTTRTKKSKEPADVTEDETNVRYKFPSPPRSVRKATRSTANKTKHTKTKNTYVKKTAAVTTLDTAILNTIESSQGYQDSDVSPPKLLRKRKLRRNTLSDKIRPISRKNNRRRSQLNYYEMSDQSSNSCPNLGLSKSIQKEGFSSNSDIYRSESLQLLMPKAKINIGMNPTNAVFNAFSEELERIINNASENNAELPSTDKDLLTLANTSNGNSSSNVSLPPSPILSIVENLSIDKNSLKGFFDDNVHGHQIEECNNDLLTNEDVTMLLMGPDCDNQATTLNAEQNNNQNSENAMDTDSILNKLCTVNLNQDNPTISDSLHQKIRNLLLESTKKIQPIPQIIVPRDSSAMDVDNGIEVDKNKRSNKRCSTPLKRQISKKTKKKNPSIEAFIEEEHTDSCSQSARRSCPPLTCNSSNVEYLNPESANQTTKPRNSRGRKKKEDIIKVKILRPKARSHSREILRKQDNNRETKSVHGDSGINETESSIHQQLDKSVELIHNHSETCLQTDECLDNSVEYVESHKSLICVTDSDLSNNIEIDSQAGTDFVKHTQCELLIGDSAANISCNVIQPIPANVSCNETLPMLSRESPNSLITEDLSEPDQEQISDRASRWYLLSEDENTNTNLPQNFDFASDLDKLFPVACAVPNLSTITEMSKDNDNRPVDPDGDTRNDLLSQSLFDSNF